MGFWLVKSEPGTWSWDAHVKAGADAWTGVRNHQAKAHLAVMQPGDQVLFYHSGDDKAVVGVSTVSRAAYPDPTDPSGRFVAVDLTAVRPLHRRVSLAEIKGDGGLKQMVLVNNSRLSVQPVSAGEWARILSLGGV